MSASIPASTSARDRMAFQSGRPPGAGRLPTAAPALGRDFRNDHAGRSGPRPLRPSNVPCRPSIAQKHLPLSRPDSLADARASPTPGKGSGRPSETRIVPSSARSSGLRRLASASGRAESEPSASFSSAIGPRPNPSPIPRFRFARSFARAWPARMLSTYESFSGVGVPAGRSQKPSSDGRSVPTDRKPLRLEQPGCNQSQRRDPGTPPSKAPAIAGNLSP